jgi:hypothetical protein
LALKLEAEMKDRLIEEIGRLTVNAAKKRQDLQETALRKGKRRKALTVLAGILALTSAGAITTVMSIAFGNIGIQLAAALTAAVSGIVSLLITSYYSDNTVFNMLQGSAQYLALRENIYSLVIQPKMSDAERFRLLKEFQSQYIRLDENYSQYFSVGDSLYSSLPPPLPGDQAIAKSVNTAERQEREHLRQELDKPGALSEDG